MKNKLRIISSVQFYIQLATGILFLHVALSDIPFSIEKVSIAILLLTGWTLGYWRRRITRRRIKKSVTDNKFSIFMKDLTTWVNKENDKL